MNRFASAILGWILIGIGIVGVCLTYYLIGLFLIFLGFFFRLIYNSEKYKFYKYIHLQLLKEYGSTPDQKKCMSQCLWGFYRGIVDLIFVVILPFFIYPQLNVNGFAGSIIAIVYILALKPIFMPLDTKDRELADNILKK